jgi:TolA-binding protein
MVSNFCYNDDQGVLMKSAILPLLLFSLLHATEITMPKQQKFYISGIEFDTKIYCAEFSKVIEEQAQKIKSLQKEISFLRQEQQKQLQKKLEKEHQDALKDTEKASSVSTPTKSKIIISDKPI